MAVGVFDNKIFNPQLFAQYVDRVPDITKLALLSSGALRARPDYVSKFTVEGGNFLVQPLKGILGGTAQNYDGSTDIVATGTHTFSQGVVAIGRAKAWSEKDFSTDIAAFNWFNDLIPQVALYWNKVYEGLLISILKGISGVSAFSSHVYDCAGTIGNTSLNDAAQKACGANADILKVVIMHSAVAKQLENAQLTEYGKYTNPQGIQSDMSLLTWNGRLVIKKDDVPFTVHNAVSYTYATTKDVAIDATKTYYTLSGEVYSAVASPDVADIATYYERTTVLTPDYTEYTSYVLGIGAFDYADLGVVNPYEAYRDPFTDGGVASLITRRRVVMQPYGFNFVIGSIVSPTNAQLESSSNWNLVHNDDSSETIDTKAIPIVLIKSRIAI